VMYSDVHQVLQFVNHSQDLNVNKVKLWSLVQLYVTIALNR
jgi:hypothetical protein